MLFNIRSDLPFHPSPVPAPRDTVQGCNPNFPRPASKAIRFDSRSSIRSMVNPTTQCAPMRQQPECGLPRTASGTFEEVPFLCWKPWFSQNHDRFFNSRPSISRGSIARDAPLLDACSLAGSTSTATTEAPNAAQICTHAADSSHADDHRQISFPDSVTAAW